jgi:AbrB family looped-hinge helix DNA binding protein
VGRLSIQELDSKGRVVLPKREREKMGIKRRVLVINAGDHIKIVPLPEKPLEALEGALEIKTPFRELRRAAEELAEDEAGRDKRCPS